MKAIIVLGILFVFGVVGSVTMVIVTHDQYPSSTSCSVK